jgi:hypothetical protein
MVTPETLKGNFIVCLLLFFTFFIKVATFVK